MNKRLSKFRLLLFVFCLIFGAEKLPLYAQDFTQTLQWSKDSNVLEYKVEIQTRSGNSVTTLTTENNYISLSLKEGSYRYRITAYDFLGREAVSTNWINFDVAIAKQPEIKHDKKLESLEEDGKSLDINVNVEDISSESKAELVNVDTKERIPGELVLSSAAAASAGVTASETQTASKAQFAEVPEGNWKLVITNPSGLSSESQSFEVKDTIKEAKLAAAKAEEERKERERLAEEQRAKEEAERLAAIEQQRRELEEIKREEEEKLAREKAEREEIARQIREQEEAEKAREEAERLALEQAQREEEERLAREEAEAQAAEEEKEKRRQKWLTYDRKFYLVAGAGSAMPVYDADFFSEFADDTMGQSVDKSIMNFSAAIQFGYLPIHKSWFRFGMEVNAIGTQFRNISDFYEMDLNMLLLQENAAFRLRLGSNKTWLQVKGGGGVVLVQERLDYKGKTENNKQNKTLNFGYFTAGGGLSFIFIPSRVLLMELGADFYNLFIPETNIGVFNPYVGLGIQL